MKFFQFFTNPQIDLAVRRIPKGQFNTYEFIDMIHTSEPVQTTVFEGRYQRPNPLYGKILKLFMLSAHTIRLISRPGASPAIWEKV